MGEVPLHGPASAMECLASLWLTEWVQLEPLGKLIPPPHGNGQPWDNASQGLHFHESSQPGAQQGGQLCLSQ